MELLLFRVIILYIFLLNAASSDSPAEELEKLQQDYFEWRLRDHPELGTQYDINTHNDKLESYAMSIFQVRKEKANSFLTRLREIKASDLAKNEKMNYNILEHMLSTYIDGYKWIMYSNLNPISHLTGPQIDLLHLVSSTMFTSKNDFEMYIRRLRLFPQRFSEYKVLMNEAIRLKRTNHAVSLKGIGSRFADLQVPVNDSFFYKPFATYIYSVDIPGTERAKLQREAYGAVMTVLDAFKDLGKFMLTTYKRNTRNGYGVNSWNNGAEFYKACMKFYLSVDMTPEQVHELGLREVERIAGKMRQIMTKLGYDNMNIGDFFPMLMKQKRFHMQSEDDLLAEYTRLMDDVIDPELPKWFKDLPGLPIKVRRMTYDGPIGTYSLGSSDGSKPGVFYVNVMRPEDIPTFSMMALTVHEGNPGHHLQISYALTASIPEFRSKQEWSDDYRIPFAMPRNEAFVEGWALYAEALAEEMGLYKTDYDLLGRYSYEMFRACRLVIDTGIHYFSWDRQKAINYMLNYTAETPVAVENEIDRYITWPGQALAYKIGELKMKELREKAEMTLEDNFNIKEFHSAVLKNGYLSLALLEDVAEEYITTASAGSSTITTTCTTTLCFIISALLVPVCYKMTIN